VQATLARTIAPRSPGNQPAVGKAHRRQRPVDAGLPDFDERQSRPPI